MQSRFSIILLFFLIWLPFHHRISFKIVTFSLSLSKVVHFSSHPHSTHSFSICTLYMKNRNSKFQIILIIITIYFENVHFFHAQLGSDVFPDMRLLHISLNTTNSECEPSSSISSFTHSLQVFLPLPAHLTPATTTFLQADAQSSPFLRSTCPNHLNLPRLTTSTPKRLYKSTLRFLSFSDTPHIHLTIIRSVLSRLCRFASDIWNKLSCHLSSISTLPAFRKRLKHHLFSSAHPGISSSNIILCDITPFTNAPQVRYILPPI